MDEPEVGGTENPSEEAGFATRAREALTGAKDTAMGTVTEQSEQAVQKVKEGARTLETKAKDNILIVAFGCLALGFALGLVFGCSVARSRRRGWANWGPWS